MFSKIFCNSKKAFLILAILILNLLAISPVLAAAGDYTPLVAIPGINANAGLMVYLNGVYTFLISIVGILAMAVLVYGGMRYVTSAGNTASVEDAKDSINSALTGLVLALVSWLIFSTINPDILVLKNVGVGLPGGKYGNAGENGLCAAAPGSGTEKDPCKCIDNSREPVYSASTGLTQTILILNVSPNPATTTAPGNNVTFSGKLTTVGGAAISGAQVKINMINNSPSFNASTTFDANTNDTGDFTYSYTSTCATGSAADVKIQAVFAGDAGDATYASAGSSPVQFVVNGATICTVLNYSSPPLPLATLWTSSTNNDCNAICSDKNLAKDGEYHCLKLNVKIGWVGDPVGSSEEQLRAMATDIGTKGSPYSTASGTFHIIELERNSTVLNTPAVYTYDTDGDMVCSSETTIPGWYTVKASYNNIETRACKPVADPKSLVCSHKYCVEDSQGNKAETLLYYRIFAP